MEPNKSDSRQTDARQIVIIGNPNPGKTTLFNHLTGLKQKVGNWAGVTVDKKQGEFKTDKHSYSITDLPGIYALPYCDYFESFSMKNIPVKIGKHDKRSFDLYLFRFLTNFYNLFKNDFDPRLDDCKKKYKTDLFNFYLNDMMEISKKFNQKLVFVTFNLKQDLIKQPTWRYDEIKNSLVKNGISHIDAYEILENNSVKNLEELDSYFGLDKHNNKKGFGLIAEELFRKL